MSSGFSCTSCGRCCHDLRLSLSLREALDWLRRGGAVQLLVDAVPDIGDDENDVAVAYRRHRAVRGVSGSLAIRVNLMVVAHFTGPCPHLLPTMRCGAYHERPATCRIYPAEQLPGRVVDPAARLCPPEAWGAPADPLRPADDALADDDIAAIEGARAASLADVAGKALLAGLLGIDTAALANEGFCVHRPDREAMEAALDAICRTPPSEPFTGAWNFVSPAPAMRDLIEGAGGTIARDWAADAYIRLG